MSEQRVLCVYKGGIKRDQIHDLNMVYLDMPAGLLKASVGNMVGYLNEQEAEQYPPGPGPDPTDPLITFRARQAISQNCAWVLITPQEAGAVLAVLGSVYHTYIAFYTPGGSGALGVMENSSAVLHLPSASGYLYVDAAGNWAPDVGGAADMRVAEIAASQDPPRQVPPSAVV